MICQGRVLLAEEMELREVPTEGAPTLARPGKEETRAEPKCIAEGAGYILECWTFRLGGKKAPYIGETSRSPYQRGREHLQEVAVGKKTHPIVLHFPEVQRGRMQGILIRTVREIRGSPEEPGVGVCHN